MKNLIKLISISAAGVLLISCGDGNSSHNADISGSGNAVSLAKGPISGFGSVIINGTRYVTSDCDITFDDAPGTESDFSLGQTITITSRPNDSGDQIAEVCVFDSDIKGTVTAIDVDNMTLSILGRTVNYNNLTQFDDVSADDTIVGQTVVVSGTFDSEQSLLATYIGINDDTEEKIKGYIEELDLDQMTFQLGALVIDYASASLDPDNLVLSNGLFVEVEGNSSQGILLATEVEQESELDLPEVEDGEKLEVEVEGFVVEIIDASSFVINGLTIIVDEETEFENGTLENISLDSYIEVEGEIQENGTLKAEEVEFEFNDDISVSATIELIDDSAEDGSVILTVLGVQFTADAATQVKNERDDDRLFNLGDLVVGDAIEIDVAALPSKWLITQLTLVESLDEVEVEATVDSFDADATQLVVLGITVDLTGAEVYSETQPELTLTEFFATLQMGDEVDIEGSYASGLLSASKVELEVEDSDGAVSDEAP